MKSEETGSKRQIQNTSLDLAIYRACYQDWTVLPSGSCENVIGAVTAMRRHASLTRITCSGIVDADDYNDHDRASLASLGVAVLPVSEIENLFLVPDVAFAILEEEGFEAAERETKFEALFEDVLAEVNSPNSIEDAVLRYCRRRIDRTLKRVDLQDSSTAVDLASVLNLTLATCFL